MNDSITVKEVKIIKTTQWKKTTFCNGTNLDKSTKNNWKSWSRKSQKL